MEWKKLTEEELLAARDYVPLMEKAAFAAECAGRCFDRMEVRVEGGQVLPYFKENVERRSRYLMGGFVKLYLGEDFEPVEGETYLMSADDYDLAGFAVGIVDRAKIIDHDRMRPGDVVIALTSSGIHSNGYSLVRKVFNVEHADLGAYVDELGCTLGEELLRPTKIYVKPVLAAMDVADVHGVSHITGGGFYENIPRCIPDGLCAKIDKSSLRTPPIFGMLQRMGSIPEHDMFNTYNMGVGMTMIVAKDDADKALAALKENGQDAYVIGEVVSGEEKVALC